MSGSLPRGSLRLEDGAAIQLEAGGLLLRELPVPVLTVRPVVPVFRLRALTPGAEA